MTGEDDEISNEVKDELGKYLSTLEQKRFYNKEARKIMLYILRHFFGIEIMPYFNYTLNLVNGLLDDNCPDIEQRFRLKHDYREYLDDGNVNPHYGEESWIVF